MKRSIIVIFLILIIFIFQGNRTIVVRSEEVAVRNLPLSLEDLRIVHLSDMHNHSHTSFSRSLIHAVHNCEPDIILFTGDLIDSKTEDYSGSLRILEGLLEIAPVIFVPGNHEYWSGLSEELFEDLQSLGVTVLLNQTTLLEVWDQTILIVGLNDPAGTSALVDLSELFETAGEKMALTILMAHRPEFFHQYSQLPVDLACTGHAHGGQFRLPIIGPVIAPDQGFFPSFTQGPYTANGTTMIVSRGLGNSIIPVRINNPPEVVLIRLSAQ